MPASALNSVVLPVLGLPTSTIVGVRKATMERCLGYDPHGYAGGFLAAQAQAEISEADFNRIAQGSTTQHFDFVALENAHFHETLHQGVVPRHCFHPRPLPLLQLVQRRHELLTVGRYSTGTD